MRIPVRHLKWARFSPSPPPGLKKSRPRGRKRQGVKYEQAAHEYFHSLFPAWRANQWIHFADEHSTRWCQPDGFVELPDRILLVEFKYQHTPEAWEQLRLVYAPVLEYLLGKRVVILECVKWFDCLTAYPEPTVLVENPQDWSGSGFGVHIWRP